MARIDKHSHPTVAHLPDLNNLPKIGINWELHTETGWGLIAIHLAAEFLRTHAAAPILVAPTRALSLNPLYGRLLSPALRAQRAFEKIVADNTDGEGDWRLPFPLLCALGAGFMGRTGVVGSENIGIIVVEDDAFSEEDLRRARHYQRFFAGSEWCAGLVRNAEVAQVTTWHQGIDGATFFPGPRANLYPDRFVVFSGGKLEYRKGQDLVVAAFRRFRERRPDALLVCQWATHFPQLAQPISRSTVVSRPPPLTPQGQLDVARWLKGEGLTDDAFVVLDFIPNAMMGGVLREVDVGLFPNRAEGGTNLVAMECLATGMPCILADNTGQSDLLSWVDAYSLEDQRAVAQSPEEVWCRDWRESNVDEIVEALEAVYRHREEAREKGRRSAEAMTEFGWDRRAQALLSLIG